MVSGQQSLSPSNILRWKQGARLVASSGYIATIEASRANESQAVGSGENTEACKACRAICRSSRLVGESYSLAMKEQSQTATVQE